MTNAPEDTPTDKVGAELRTLQTNYLRKLPILVKDLGQRWMGFLETGNEGLLAELRHHSHSIAGTAGVLGIDEISRLAQALVDDLKPSASELLKQPEQAGKVSQRLDEIKIKIASEPIVLRNPLLRS